MATATLTYDANGGDYTPPPQTYTFDPPDKPLAYLADAITKGTPSGKYAFAKWKVGDTLYNAGESFAIDEDTVAVAQFRIVPTTVSPKAYGWSPNGTKNPLGKTRFHHQPNYPKPMGK